MFQDQTQGAAASIVLPIPELSPQFETVRHMMFGSLSAVQLTIMELHTKHYAEPNDWSKPISTGRPNEVMVILTRNIRMA
ncbi:hypothetical protein IQ260_08990 [Leptolyngbya cf. ectocarpi LEGE 11479]|uniref:Uncharacterized protein n=1 Tax=Leptolyngbya cf. ectocarpi LEGE 11479 TaxID=1828722 RepID=A0A928X0N8_LEPEC|nr:hypothetical protein [Leptolyngbya ectocarpi]MBE9066787.1 hypothetical protein [Leptolyngbya cf. ectocarpi LEGE 11479]